MNIDEWVCIEDSEDDYEIERFEVRVKGKKPLVINNPSYTKLLFTTQQYLNCSSYIVKELIRRTILDSPSPLTLSEHLKLIKFLEKK